MTTIRSAKLESTTVAEMPSGPMNGASPDRAVSAESALHLQFRYDFAQMGRQPTPERHSAARLGTVRYVTEFGIASPYVHSFMTQTTQTVLANGRSKIEDRLARWLLMAHDRVDSDEIPLTHEFLAIMLGVRRSGVTVALQELERKGLIAHRRSVITMVDREALEHSTNGTYSPPNDW